ncbi:hypothetical protein HDA39_000124 [Kribbella italica]|uniref:Uncharacterized protein n=1 Tax=Kribbella italica TaxID=1540520 RepID=A0A7W9J112_9ACTN|nr:hypothetical protein [Kribbella italica]MBB5833390.1 hypothetical protein [Kribbella italica]
MSSYESPPLPHEWQFHRPRSVLIEHDAVRSSCSGHLTIWETRPRLTGTS